MCSNCEDMNNLEIVTPTEWEFIPGHLFLITQVNFNDDNTFHVYVKSIFIEFINGNISYFDLLRFIELGCYKIIPVQTKCSQCHNIFENLSLCYYGTIAYEYDRLLEDFFLDAFKNKYHACGQFLYKSLIELPELIELFFKKDKLYAKKLLSLYSIRHDIPYERGGDSEAFYYAINSIVLSLFGNFLYQLFLQDATEKLKQKAYKLFDVYKKKIKRKKIISQLRKYMKNEHVEWNEDRAVELVNQSFDSLVERYIDSIIDNG